MKLQLDPNREYGLVFEGGGAKGAYQVGAWRALKEAGLCIRGVAGTSVGALNGALVCMGDLKKAQTTWESISYSSVMDVDESLIEKTKNFRWKDLPDLVSEMTRLIKDKGVDITPLKTMLGEMVDEKTIRNSPIDLYVITYSVSDRKAMSVNVKELPEGEIADMLMASAYLIGFKPERLGGKFYMDGGSVNNVPVDVLIDRGYKDLIVIRIYGLGVDTERSLKVPEDVSIHHIYPRQDLGGILEFNRRRIKKNMILGYFDACRMLYGLLGRIYYIDAEESEAYYFDRMITELPFLLGALKPELKEELESAEGAQGGYRRYTEQLLPQLAKELRLKEDWNYKTLYLGLLEELARQFRISRFKIYRAEELDALIHRKVISGKSSLLPLPEAGLDREDGL